MNYKAVNDLVGTDWVYLDNDCFAVFRKGSKSIFGRDIKSIDLPEISNQLMNECIFSEQAASDYWQKVETPQPGDAVLFYNKHNCPFHIGLLIEGDNVLHCPGTVKRPGRTVYERLSNMSKFIYKRYEFFRPCN